MSDRPVIRIENPAENRRRIRVEVLGSPMEIESGEMLTMRMHAPSGVLDPPASFCMSYARASTTRQTDARRARIKRVLARLGIFSPPAPTT